MLMKMIASAWRTEIERAQTFPTLLPSPSQCTQCLRNILNAPREMQKVPRYCERCNNQCNALNLHCDLLCLHNEVKYKWHFLLRTTQTALHFSHPSCFASWAQTGKSPTCILLQCSSKLFDSPPTSLTVHLSAEGSSTAIYCRLSLPLFPPPVMHKYRASNRHTSHQSSPYFLNLPWILSEVRWHSEYVHIT